MWFTNRQQFCMYFGPLEDILVQVWHQRGHFGQLLAPKSTLGHVKAPRRAFKYVFWLPIGDLSSFLGSQESSLACVLVPKRAVYHVLTT